MLWISPWLAIPPVVVFGIIVITGTIAQHRLHELSQTTYRASAQRNATLVESLTGIETIKTQGAEGVIQARWERINTFLSRINVRMRGLSSGAMYAANTLTQFATVAVILIGVYLIGDRQLTMGGADRLHHARRARAGAGRADRGPADAVPGRAHRARIARPPDGQAGGAALARRRRPAVRAAPRVQGRDRIPQRALPLPRPRRHGAGGRELSASRRASASR